MKRGKKKMIFRIIAGIILILAITAAICLYHFIGVSKCVGEKKYQYEMQEIHVTYDDIDLYGKALIPESDTEETFPTVIFAHGAESNYKSDMATLKSLAKSGVACYTFDFYGWTDRSTGPKGTHWFKDVPRGVDDSYEQKVLQQVEDLNAVIEKVKTFSFVDKEQLYLLGSSMGGATVAATSVEHSEDISGIILQYPAINLVPGAMKDGDTYSVNRYEKPVLLLQGTKDKIVPQSMSDALAEYYNKEDSNHCKYVIYEGQPHVFDGKYKVIAAEEIYQFIRATSK